MRFAINGRQIEAEFDLRTSLLDLLRDHLGLTGSKKGCDQGACGACTVLVDGERINACLALAVQYQGRAITTVEGLGDGGAMHPLQLAFIEHDGFQCGYCTPGMILSGAALLRKKNSPSDAEVKEAMQGNVCRCGAYNRILAAMQKAAGAINAEAKAGRNA